MKLRWLVVVALSVSTVGLESASLSAEEPNHSRPHPFSQREHAVWRMNDEAEPTSIPAEMHWISEPWLRDKADENAQMPYLAYLAEKDRVLMLVETHQPIRTAFIHSDDHGQTWSDRRWLSVDAAGQPNGVAHGLTNFGGGKLLVFPENVAQGKWLSHDYGETWKLLPVRDVVKTRYVWDPLCVLRGSNGKVTKVLEASWRETGIPWGSAEGYYSQAYFRTSSDEGESWTEEAKVPQWLGVNEVNLIRAANGDLVAACRTDYPRRFAHLKLDHFGGLATSISKDEGRTWSKLNPLYEWGRHHPSQVLLPNGDLLMSYVVRLGYPATWQGRPQFGVEAIVSRDHGQTWDKAHRYVLASWEGNITGETAWFCGVQSTSTILLPDGMLLTAFGTGFRNPAGAQVCKMDVALVRWRTTGSQAPEP